MVGMKAATAGVLPEDHQDQGDVDDVVGGAHGNSPQGRGRRLRRQWRGEILARVGVRVDPAVRRVNLTDRSKESMLDYIDRERMFILPNTAGCYTADESSVRPGLLELTRFINRETLTKARCTVPRPIWP